MENISQSEYKRADDAEEIRIRNRCKPDKEQVRNEPQVELEDNKINDILSMQSTIDREIFCTEEEIAQQKLALKSIGAELDFAKSEVDLAQEAIDNFEYEKKPLFMSQKRFLEKQNSIIGGLNSNLDAATNKYKELERKHSKGQETISTLEEKRNFQLEKKAKEIYHIYVEERACAAKLGEAFSNLKTASKVTEYPYSVLYDRLPDNKYDMKLFSWEQKPFALAVKERSYIFSDKGILVFDKYGIYEGVLPVDSISCEMKTKKVPIPMEGSIPPDATVGAEEKVYYSLQHRKQDGSPDLRYKNNRTIGVPYTDEYWYQAVLQIQIAMEHLEITVSNLNVAKALDKAIADYRIPHAPLVPCYPIMNLLSLCISTNNGPAEKCIERMKSKEV